MYLETLQSFLKKIDTSLFVQKPFLGINFLESNLEEEIDMKDHYRIKNLPDPISIRESALKIYVGNIYENDIDFNDVNIEKWKFVKVNYQPAVSAFLTLKIHFDNPINNLSLVRNNQQNDFNNHNLTNINSITLNTEAVNDNQVIIKAYVDQFHQDNERSRRDLG